MSSSLVCEAIETEYGKVFGAEVPFHQTMNEEVEVASLPDLWVTTQYSDANEARIDIGSPRALWREEGVATIAILFRAGKGKVTARQFADRVRDHFRPFHGINGELRILSASPARESSDRVIGDFYVVSVDMVYRYSFFR